MKYFLLKMDTYGMKSIDKKLEISFYKKTLKKEFSYEKSHVKGIYGSNGAGKTAIAYAMDIYKSVIVDKNAVALLHTGEKFENYINQDLNEFYVCMTFAVLDDKNIINDILSHSIKIAKVNNEYKIIEECLKKFTTLKYQETDKHKVIFHSKNNEIVDCDNTIKEELVNKTMNILNTQSVVNTLSFQLNNDVFTNIKDCIVNTIYFALNITIVMQYSDTNNIHLNAISNALKTLKVFEDKLSKEDFTLLMLYNSITADRKYTINKDRFNEYEVFINNLTKFIKVFKDNLVDIEIKTDEAQDNYECENIFVYNNRRVAEKFESTGIKKLTEIYFALCNIEKGHIVFIDEFDANVHDVLLMKLIEYIAEYTEGQFIFTTHNAGPMDYLSSLDFSLDFLSSDSELVSWKKNGNYKPSSLYRKGLIDKSPFNIEPFSFLGSFGGEE